MTRVTQGPDGGWIETPVSSSGSPRRVGTPLGDLPLFLQHVAPMRELDEHRDKVWDNQVGVMFLLRMSSSLVPTSWPKLKYAAVDYVTS